MTIISKISLVIYISAAKVFINQFKPLSFFWKFRVMQYWTTKVTKSTSDWRLSIRNRESWTGLLNTLLFETWGQETKPKQLQQVSWQFLLMWVNSSKEIKKAQPLGNKGFSSQHSNLADSQRQAEDWERFTVRKGGGFRCVPAGGWWHCIWLVRGTYVASSACPKLEAGIKSRKPVIFFSKDFYLFIW